MLVTQSLNDLTEKGKPFEHVKYILSCKCDNQMLLFS